MNEKEIKNQIVKKYHNILSKAGFDFGLQNEPLQTFAFFVQSVFESQNLPVPEDLLAHNLNSNNPDNAISDDSRHNSNADSKEEFNYQQSNPIETKPINLPEFNLEMFRYLNTDKITAQNRNISCEDLFEYRKNITRNLAIFDNITGVRYKDSILEELKKINDQPKNGIIISVLLHNGDRINKIFESEDSAASIYYWTASQDKMIKANIKPGHFIIIKNTGEEIIPDKAINEQIKERQILLNVRIL